MVTVVYVPDEFVEQIRKAHETDQNVSQYYNKMFMSGYKTTVTKLRDKMVDLYETKDLYGRLLIVTQIGQIH